MVRDQSARGGTQSAALAHEPTLHGNDRLPQLLGPTATLMQVLPAESRLYPFSTIDTCCRELFLHALAAARSFQ